MTPVILSDRYGRSYHFAAFAMPTIPPDIAGIYAIGRIVHVAQRPLFQVQYIGSTGSLCQRLWIAAGNHDGLRRALSLGATHIAYLAADCTDAMRFNIETMLRQAYSPPCNMQDVPTTGVPA